VLLVTLYVPDEGEPYRPERISSVFQRIVRDAALPPLGIHGLRHTFATLGLENGADVLYVAKVLGHSSPAITQGIYQHASRERTREAMSKIGAAIFG
jgi:integrase